MKKRIYHSKSRGQSIPLIAVMLVVLFGFVALAMDVGNVYAEQREVVRATNSASLEAMDAIVLNRGDGNYVLNRVITSLQSNRIPIPEAGAAAQPGDMTVNISYLDSAGSVLMTCPGDACGANSDAKWASLKSQIAYVKVAVDGNVDTYFARLLGQEQFPVNASAHAQSGICVSGVYPMAVDASILNTTNYTFIEPDRLYTDDAFTRVSQKRLFLRGDVSTTTGQFGLLRWKSSDGFSSASPLISGLTGKGTLDNGFTEAPWPLTSAGVSAVSLAKTDGYPQVPGNLNANEWLYGSAASLFSNTSVQSSIDDLIRNRTIVNLPIYTYVTANAANVSDPVYYMRDVQRFLIVGRGTQSGSQYIDAAYIGEGDRCTSLATPPVSQTMTLAGNISLYPQYEQRPEQNDPPIQYLVVLDISGSMTWNFAGYGSAGSTDPLCQGTGAVYCHPTNSQYRTVSERRLAIAYNALNVLVDRAREKDRIQIITYSAPNADAISDPFDPMSNQDALDRFSQVYPGFWTNDKPTLRTAVSDATRSPTFYSTGSTASAIGLARARTIFADSEEYVTIDGLRQRYKRAVIFITDGVANVTRDGRVNSSCGEQVDCNLGIDGVIIDGQNHQVIAPINAMRDEGVALTDLIRTSGGAVYPVAMGPVGTTTLVGMGQTPVLADTPAKFVALLQSIQQEIQEGPCTAFADRTTPLTTVNIDNLPVESEYSQPWNTAGLRSGEVGVVTVRESGSGAEYTGIMRWDSSGRVRYEITNLPPGNYTMTYWMVFRGTDGKIRVYDYGLKASNPSGLSGNSLEIPLRPDSNSFTQDYPIIMDMSPIESAKVCAVAP